MKTKAVVMKQLRKCIVLGAISSRASYALFGPGVLLDVAKVF